MLFLVSAGVIFLSILGSAFTGAGSGTSSDPYQINNLSTLNETRNNLTAHYKLVSDINASDTENWNSGKGFDPISIFKGELRGNNYSIENLTIARSSEDNVGLFGQAGEWGGSDTDIEIRNLSLENVDIEGNRRTAALIGLNYHANVSNVNVTGNITANSHNLGGLIAINYGVITEAWLSADVKMDSLSSNTGGLAGRNEPDTGFGIINESFVDGTVDSSGKYIGGLIGENNAEIWSSYSRANVSGIYSSEYIGGFAGENTADIYRSYSTGNVSGGSTLGGFSSTNSGTITDSYWDINTSNQDTSAGGTGLTTSEMKEKSNLNGFDFTNTWEYVYGSNDEYPVLQVFNFTSENINPEIKSLGGPEDGKNTDPSGGVELSAEVGDPNDDQKMDIWFFDGSDSLIDSVVDKGNGTYSISWDSVSSDQSYSWYVELSDGFENVTSTSKSFTTVDISLSWNDNSGNEDGFKIYNNASGSYQKIGTVETDTTSYTDTSINLETGKYTCYRIKAYNQYGESDPLEGCITP